MIIVQFIFTLTSYATRLHHLQLSSVSFLLTNSLPLFCCSLLVPFHFDSYATRFTTPTSSVSFLFLLLPILTRPLLLRLDVANIVYILDSFHPFRDYSGFFPEERPVSRSLCRHPDAVEFGRLSPPHWMFCNSQRDVFFFCCCCCPPPIPPPPAFLAENTPDTPTPMPPTPRVLPRSPLCARVDIFSYLCVLSKMKENSPKIFPHDDIEDKDNDDVNVNDASRIRIKERASERMRNVAVSFERCTTQKRCSKSFFLLNRQSRRRRPIREVMLCAL